MINMIQIIPAIISQDFEELQKKIKKVESYVDLVQLDVMDGKFVDNLTWNQPTDLRNLKTSLKLEVHLMVQNPENIIDDWIKSGIQRIIFHYESTKNPEGIIKRIKQAGLQVGLAINPETSVKSIDAFINQLDLVLIMTVHPGKGGQEFLEETLWKIKELREEYKDLNIGVDGGINIETAPKVIQVGANIFFIGSSIFKSENFEEAIKKLKNGY